MDEIGFGKLFKRKKTLDNQIILELLIIDTLLPSQALSDVTEHYRSLYHKQSDPEATEPTTTVPSSDDKFQSGPAFVDFKRSVTVTFNQDVLREIRSPSQSPDRAGDVEKPETREEYRSRDVESRDQTRTHDETRSPGASIRSPSLSPPPSETSSPGR